MPWRATGTQHVGEPRVHPAAHVLPVAQAIVLERDVFVVGQQVEGTRSHGVRDALDVRAAGAAIALVPDGGRHRVRVADEDGTAPPSRLVLESILLAGDLDEVLLSPDGVLGTRGRVARARDREEVHAVLAAILGNPLRA